MSEVLLHFLGFGFLMSALLSSQHVLELIVGGEEPRFLTTLMQPRVILLWHKLDIEKK